jgi:hypothetical protein
VPGARRTQAIEADPGRGDHEPTANIVNLGDIDGEQTGKRVLDDVFSLADTAEHAIGDIEQISVVVAPDIGELGIAGVSFRWYLLIHVMRSSQKGPILETRTEYPARV